MRNISTTPARQRTRPRTAARNAPARFRGQGPARQGRRIASVSLCVVALAAAAAAPAMATTAPSMTTDGNNVNITAQGPSHTLDFYWQTNGSSTWNPEQIADPGTIFSAPSMTTDGNNVNIATEGRQP
jgi:hypothetical protein